MLRRHEVFYKLLDQTTSSVSNKSLYHVESRAVYKFVLMTSSISDNEQAAFDQMDRVYAKLSN